MPTLADLFGGRYLASGTDFASVRLHYGGADVDRACRALGARAFTVGQDIYFADRAFRPDRREGLWLLAHEVAHVVQQSAGLVPTSGAGGAAASPAGRPALWVAPAGTAQERAADAAADAFVAGRPFVFSAAGTGARAPGRPLVVQRYMAWEHSLLGDLDPARVRATAAGDPAHIGGYRDLLSELGREPRQQDETRLRARHPGLDTVRLPGSGLVVTLGELNVLPDYLGRPEEIEAAPLAFIGPLIQSVRSWSIAELGRPGGQRRALPGRPPCLLPGSLLYPLLGPLAETAEIAAVTALGSRRGFAPSDQYASVLARNACHFAPFSWYRWHSFHLMARSLIARSATVSGTDREALRLRARICAGYADHFLQDSFAAGHLVNKTLLIQWYIEWLADAGVSYPGRDLLDTLTVARQPLLHGPGHYDRSAARAGGLAGDRAGAVPGPPWDPQDVADAPGVADRIAASGVTGDSDAERRAAYAAYLTMLRSGTVQLAVKVAHEYLNRQSLLVASGPDGPAFRLHGDHTLLADGEGSLRAARAAQASRQAISELLRQGETEISSWDIFDSFPDHVQHDGRLVSLTDWHQGGLRDLCSGLFARRSTRALRAVMSSAFDRLGTPIGELFRQKPRCCRCVLFGAHSTRNRTRSPEAGSGQSAPIGRFWTSPARFAYLEWHDQ
ncbi:MAG: DUF4157 domain-containing protein [Trebonia sp.]